jgi:bifunctional UDP-N-acetylglucosamine pyrophosphorylase / glucosamine-1-phosphate N-acetyltransferase
MQTRVIILAAGKGTRMKSDIPKALTSVAGKPILQYLHESILESGVDDRPVVVIGPERQKLCEAFGGLCDYAVQEEQLGTGHAVQSARDVVADARAVIVLYGDHPFVSSITLRRLIELHERAGGVVTMMTTTLSDFDDWRCSFLHWGRILRDSHGHIVGVREYKDAMESEQAIREVNPGLYCFDTAWLWKNIDQIKNFNANGEYYLTDLIELAVAQGQEIVSMSVASEEVIGINTQAEREIAEQVLTQKKITT